MEEGSTRSSNEERTEQVSTQPPRLVNKGAFQPCRLPRSSKLSPTASRRWTGNLPAIRRTSAFPKETLESSPTSWKRRTRYLSKAEALSPSRPRPRAFSIHPFMGVDHKPYIQLRGESRVPRLRGSASQAEALVAHAKAEAELQ